MKLKKIIEKTMRSELDESVEIIEIQYRCPCKISKVIHVREVSENVRLIDEDILCSYCESYYEIIPNTMASEVKRKDEVTIEPHLFPKRRKNGLKPRGKGMK